MQIAKLKKINEMYNAVQYKEKKTWGKKEYKQT